MKIKLARLAPTLTGMAIVFFMLFVYVTELPLVASLRERLESLAYDVRLNATLPDRVRPDERVVIVDIDEESLREEGHWPWPRARVADLIDALFEAKAAVVTFDIVFAERDRNPVEELLADEHAKNTLAGLDDSLAQLRDELDGDRKLARAFANRKPEQSLVTGFVLADKIEHSVGKIPPPLPGTEDAPVDLLPVRPLDQYVGNIDILQDAANGGGCFIVEPDPDGLIRRAPLILRHRDQVYGSLALESVRALFGNPDVRLAYEKVGDEMVVESLSLVPKDVPNGKPMMTIPTDQRGYVIIPYRGPAESFRYISATDIMQGNFDRKHIENAVVLIGTSAEGLYDLRATPVERVYPGVEIHANIILRILEGDFPRADWLATGIDAALLLGLGLLFALLFPHLKPILLVVVTLVAMAGQIGLNLWLWNNGLVTALALPLMMIFILGVGNAVNGYLLETRGRQQLKNMFGQYVPPELVNEMNQNPSGSFGFEGESREMTVLFCDIRGFTTISESLSAAELKQLLNWFFTPMTQIIFDHRGTIDKYVGDMIMAFWGAPLEDPDHRKNAIQTALAMLERVEQMKPEIAERGWPEVNVGIGLNTGVMNVGDMGSEFRRSYTVLGDAVNLGSRLEGLTKFYGVRLIVSETTMAEQRDFLFRKLDLVRVKGKHEAVAIYEPVALAKDASPMLEAELREYERALRAYYRKDWQTAASRFKSLAETNAKVKVYKLYLERIKSLHSQQLPDDWDGVFTHTSK